MNYMAWKRRKFLYLAFEILGEFLLSRAVTRGGVWIGNWIYWTLTFVKSFSVFTSRCLIAASNGGHSPCSGFPNCPWPQLSASHFSQCDRNCTENVSSIIVCSLVAGETNVSPELFPSNGCCTVAFLHSCYLALWTSSCDILKMLPVGGVGIQAGRSGVKVIQ
jgi:hypothetical protein